MKTTHAPIIKHYPLPGDAKYGKLLAELDFDLTD